MGTQLSFKAVAPFAERIVAVLDRCSNTEPMALAMWRHLISHTLFHKGISSVNFDIILSLSGIHFIAYKKISYAWTTQNTNRMQVGRQCRGRNIGLSLIVKYHSMVVVAFSGDILQYMLIHVWTIEKKSKTRSRKDLAITLMNLRT